MCLAVLTVAWKVSLLCTNEIAIEVDLALRDAPATVWAWDLMPGYASFNTE